MSNGALLQKSMNDKLDLPEQFTALELVCDAEQSIVEEANFHKDPEFVIGSIAMEYDIVKMDSKRKWHVEGEGFFYSNYFSYLLKRNK